MTTIPAALAALEQVHLAERKDGTTYSVYDGGDTCYKAIDDAKLDAIAWIKEALPWLKAYRQQQIMANLHGYNCDVDPLTALIEQAEGGKE